jgi:hypothetical protein
MNSRVIEYKKQFNLGYNDTSRETFIKFLNDEQTINGGQIININASLVNGELYILNSMEFVPSDNAKKIYGITGTIRKNVKMLKIASNWYACVENN